MIRLPMAEWDNGKMRMLVDWDSWPRAHSAPAFFRAPPTCASVERLWCNWHSVSADRPGSWQCGYRAPSGSGPSYSMPTTVVIIWSNLAHFCSVTGLSLMAAAFKQKVGVGLCQFPMRTTHEKLEYGWYWFKNVNWIFFAITSSNF